MKITIIGAGIIGVTSAYFLSKNGFDVEVIERREGAGLETSFANAGMLTPSMSDPWNSPGIFWSLLKNIGRSDSGFLLRLKAIPSLVVWGLRFLANSNSKKYLNNMHVSSDLSCYSLELLKEMRDDISIDYEGIETGSLKIFRDPKSMKKYAALANELGRHGMRFKILSPAEVLDVEPSLEAISHELCGGIYYPDDEAGNAYKFTSEIAKMAAQNGVQFNYGETVTKIVKNNDRIEKIITSRGEYISDNYVICAGSFSALFGDDLGFSVPVRPAKGYSISVPMNGWNKAPKRPIVDDDFHGAITPLGGVLRIAGTAELTGYDDTLTKERIDNLYNFLDEVYPEFSNAVDRSKVEEWSGFRPMTVDGVPIIGKTPLENLYLNTGHGPLGWTMAVGSAKMLTDIISGTKPALNENAYSLSRL